MKVILYSTHCPKCKVLETKIKTKNIEYEEINDMKIMKEKGFASMPMLEVDGTIMDFKTAFRYIDKL